MESLQNRAVEKFRSGFNCSQAVLTTFSGKYHLDESTAMVLSCGFGAGMGRLQETCGAVTGSFMALSLHICSCVQDNKERKEKLYGVIQEFDRKFKALHGTCRCSELLNLDLKTQEGQKIFHDEKLGEKVCEKCISNAVKLVSELSGKF